MSEMFCCLLAPKLFQWIRPEQITHWTKRRRLLESIQLNKQTDIEGYRETHRQTHREIHRDRHVGMQTDRQTDSQTDTEQSMGDGKQPKFSSQGTGTGNVVASPISSATKVNITSHNADAFKRGFNRGDRSILLWKWAEPIRTLSVIETDIVSKYHHQAN